MPAPETPGDVRTHGDWPAFPRGDDQTPGVSFREYAAVHLAAALVAQFPVQPAVIAGRAVAIADELARHLMAPPPPELFDLGADALPLGASAAGYPDDGRSG